MIRKANSDDIPAIADTYTELLSYEAQHGGCSNWKSGLYPTIAVPKTAVPAGTMYVLEDGGELCASMVLNHTQAEEYDTVNWQYTGEGNKVLVIHTLCVPPRRAGCGYGRQMVAYAKEYAAKASCTTIRLDTYAQNEPAKRLYLQSGFRIARYGRILLQGLIDEEQVYLECEV